MDFVMVFGPPAVGKMTVGHEVARLTGYKLFHNHMTVEPVLDIFPFGSEPFGRLVSEFRQRVIEEAVGAALPGLVFTMVWGLELPEDRDLVASYVDIVEKGGDGCSSSSCTPSRRPASPATAASSASAGSARTATARRRTTS